MKLILNKANGYGFILYIDGKKNLVISDSLNNRSLKTEKTLLENCICFDGGIDSGHKAHITALTADGDFIYITAENKNIRRIKVLGKEREIMPESLKILTFGRICFILLCIRENDEFAYYSFLLSESISKPDLIIKTDRYFPPLYISKNPDGNIELILRQNGKYMLFKYLWNIKRWDLPLKIFDAENDFEKEFFVAENNVIHAVYLNGGIIYYAKAAADENGFLQKTPEPLTGQHMKEHGEIILYPADEKINLMWYGSSKLFFASGNAENGDWSKLEQYNAAEPCFVYKICSAESTLFRYGSESRIYGIEEFSVSDISVQISEMAKTLQRHEEYIKKLKEKFKNF